MSKKKTSIWSKINGNGFYTDQLLQGVSILRSQATNLTGYIKCKMPDLFRLSLSLPFLASVLIFSCNSPYTPKPKGYFKIDFPGKKYQSFNQPGYPYTFEYPVYATIVKDSMFFGGATENPWWININFPRFNGRIYVSYKEIGKDKLDKLINDAYSLTNKHSSKDYSIEDSLMVTPNRVSGIFFKVGGNVATANQFFLTDSTKHFLRGAFLLPCDKKPPA